MEEQSVTVNVEELEEVAAGGMAETISRGEHHVMWRHVVWRHVVWRHVHVVWRHVVWRYVVISNFLI